MIAVERDTRDRLEKLADARPLGKVIKRLVADDRLDALTLSDAEVAELEASDATVEERAGTLKAAEAKRDRLTGEVDTVRQGTEQRQRDREAALTATRACRRTGRRRGRASNFWPLSLPASNGDQE